MSQRSVRPQRRGSNSRARNPLRSAKKSRARCSPTRLTAARKESSLLEVRIPGALARPWGWEQPRCPGPLGTDHSGQRRGKLPGDPAKAPRNASTQPTASWQRRGAGRQRYRSRQLRARDPTLLLEHTASSRASVSRASSPALVKLNTSRRLNGAQHSWESPGGAARALLAPGLLLATHGRASPGAVVSPEPRPARTAASATHRCLGGDTAPAAPAQAELHRLPRGVAEGTARFLVRRWVPPLTSQPQHPSALCSEQRLCVRSLLSCSLASVTHSPCNG